METLPFESRLLQAGRIVGRPGDKQLELLWDNEALKIEAVQPVNIKKAFPNTEFYFFYENENKEIYDVAAFDQDQNQIYYRQLVTEYPNIRAQKPRANNLCLLSIERTTGKYRIWQTSFATQCDMYFLRTQKIASGTVYMKKINEQHVPFVHGISYYYPEIKKYIDTLGILNFLPLATEIPPTPRPVDKGLLCQNTGVVAFWSDADGKGIIRGKLGYASVSWEDLPSGKDFRYLPVGQVIGFKEWNQVAIETSYRNCPAVAKGIILAATPKPLWLNNDEILPKER